MVKIATHSDPNPRTHSAPAERGTWPGTEHVMQGRTGFSLRLALAASTIAASAIALAPLSDAAPAESCLKAPHGVAPQGSHWYYRLERPSQHRCWYLAEKGRKPAHRAVARTAPAIEKDQDQETDSPSA